MKRVLTLLITLFVATYINMASATYVASPTNGEPPIKATTVSAANKPAQNTVKPSTGNGKVKSPNEAEKPR